MARSKLQLRIAQSPVLRYGLPVASVTIVIPIGLFLEHHEFRHGPIPLFLFAVASSAWYGGAGPAILATALSTFSFDRYFGPPVHTLNFTLADVPAFFFLLPFGALITGFSAVRRRVEAELLRARDRLEIEVAERIQQASLLNLTHDTIFVRDMSDSIRYVVKPVEFHEFVIAIEELGDFWAVINAPPPGSVKK
jgi:K+-sensing histidine kinase KdpD